MQGKSDDAGRTNPDGHCCGDEGARRFHMSVLRMVKSAIQLKEVEKLRKLDDAESIQLLQTILKQRKESIEQFPPKGKPAGTRGEGQKGSRADRAISPGGSFGGRNERGDRQSHRGNRRTELHTTKWELW